MIPEEIPQLKPYTVVHEDGSKEVIFLKENVTTNKLSFRDHMTLAYILVGTVTLAMTAYISYLQLKRMK